eukprot:387921-Prorocentrum_minimum.AAC.1
MRKPKANAYLASDQDDEPPPPQPKRGAYVTATVTTQNRFEGISSGFQTQERPTQRPAPAFDSSPSASREFSDGFAGFGSSLIAESHGHRCNGRNCKLFSSICVCLLLVFGASALALVLTGGSSDNSPSIPNPPPSPASPLPPPKSPRASPPPSPPPSPPGAAFVSMVASRLNDKCLQIIDFDGGGRENGAKVEMWDCKGTQSQLWRMEDGTLRSLYSDKCLEIDAFNMGNNATLQMFDCVISILNQQWTREGEWEVNGNTTAVLKSQMSQKCLELVSSDIANGVAVQVYECNGGESQQWYPRLLN